MYFPCSVGRGKVGPTMTGALRSFIKLEMGEFRLSTRFVFHGPFDTRMKIPVHSVHPCTHNLLSSGLEPIYV